MAKIAITRTARPAICPSVSRDLIGRAAAALASRAIFGVLDSLVGVGLGVTTGKILVRFPGVTVNSGSGFAALDGAALTENADGGDVLGAGDRVARLTAVVTDTSAGEYPVPWMVTVNVARLPGVASVLIRAVASSRRP